MTPSDRIKARRREMEQARRKRGDAARRSLPASPPIKLELAKLDTPAWMQPARRRADPNFAPTEWQPTDFALPTRLGQAKPLPGLSAPRRSIVQWLADLLTAAAHRRTRSPNPTRRT